LRSPSLQIGSRAAKIAKSAVGWIGNLGDLSIAREIIEWSIVV
jgi:hypothetical protein